MTDTEVTAALGDNGEFTATVNVVNNGALTTLTPSASASGRPDCSVKVENPTLPGLQASDLKLTLGANCRAPGAALDVKYDLDGADGIPEITIKSPTRPVTPWVALFVGGAAGAVAFFSFWGKAAGIHHRVRGAKVPDSGCGETAHGQARINAYMEVKRLVTNRWDDTMRPQKELGWDDLKSRTYDATDQVESLEAGWSLKDSWLANITTLVSAVVALASSSQLFTALGAEPPKGPLAVMAVAGLVGVALVTVANTIVKLIGQEVNKVTVRGMAISTAALCAAAVFEIWTVTIAAGYAFHMWSRIPRPLNPKGPQLLLREAEAGDRVLSAFWPVAMFVIAALLTRLSWRYLSEGLEQVLNDGVPASGVPAVDMAEFATWTVPPPKTIGRGWWKSTAPAWGEPRTDKQDLLEHRIRTALGPWLKHDKQATTRIGEPWAKTGVIYGETKWGPGGELGQKPPGEHDAETEQDLQDQIDRRRQQQSQTPRRTRCSLL